MTEINWGIFQSKYNGKERTSFEHLAYMLFCYEFNLGVGVFRFKNQTGIETEPVLVNGNLVGFQAKYFETGIGGNKNDIIDSLNKAKTKNPGLDKILLYTNQELSENRSKNKKKPSYQEDIEAAAYALKVELEWRVPSHFEKQLAVPENEYMAQHFFGSGPGVVNFLESFKEHSENVLLAIQTAIPFKGQQIKVDRRVPLSKIEASVGQVIILTGDGGSGKTALVKELLSERAEPCYVLKATEFNKQSSAEIFNQFGRFSIGDFLRFHEHERKKMFVIDSAEKLADLPERDVFIEFLSALLEDNWTVIFTTRNSYLDDLTYQMVDVYHRPFEVVRLQNLSPEELAAQAVTYGFQLPADPRVLRLVANLFYLKEFLGNYDVVGGQMDVVRFRDILWKKKIQNSGYRKDNTHLEREKCFLALAKERCSTGNFLLHGGDGEDRILALLEADEIIKSESNKTGYFITHDIYEEWALERLIDNEYASLMSYESFLANIGESLPMRRAFRSWLSERLADASADVKYFVEQALSSRIVPAFWKDEIFVSILLSDYCTTFFLQFGDTLLTGNKALLKKIAFLLRTACKEIDAELHGLMQNAKEVAISLEHVFTKPKGRGWEATIVFLHEKLALIEKEELEIFLPVLKDWVSNNRRGNTTRLAGLFALHFYKDAELTKEIYYGKELEEVLLELVLLAAPELKNELTAITDSLLTASTSNYHRPFDSFQEAVLTDNNCSLAFIVMEPARTMQLADHAWYERPTDVDDEDVYYSGHDVETHYAINRHWHRDYFPASALQTPIYLLLQFSFAETIDFILDFTNRTVEAYFASGFDPSAHEVEVSIGIESKKQILSNCLWNMYRGSGSPVSPYLLQSIHMALEKRLLELAKKIDKAVLESWLIYLLTNTRSASITAIVTSVVLAHSDELFDVAKILFGNFEFFLYDGQRMISENVAKSIYSIGRGYDYRTKQFEDERIATCDDPHRKLSLENLALNYQFFSNEKLSEDAFKERQKEIWDIIDQLSSTLHTHDAKRDEHKKRRLLLARMDRRKMNPTIGNRDENSLLIEFNPELSEDLKEFSKKGQEAFDDVYKHLGIKHWAVAKLEGKELSPNHAQYEDNPECVLEEVKTVLERLQSREEDFFMVNSSTPVYVCAALLKFYSAFLNEEDLSFCADNICWFAAAPLRTNYGYQIGDGVEVAVNTLPVLYGLVPKSAPELNGILFLTLFDTYSLGEYKRICDYAIEALHTLFEVSPTDANVILLNYMILKPKFDADNPQSRWRHERKSRVEVLDEFIAKYNTELEAIGNKEDAYTGVDFTTQSLPIAETALQIIPVDTTDPRHLDYIRKLLQTFSSALFAETRYSQSDYDETDHKLKHRFFKKFAAFLLHRESECVAEWAKPLASAFSLTRETANFLSEVVSAEDQLGKYGSFWATWESFYPVISTAAQKSRDHDLNEIITNYLLAWPWWRDTAKEWRSLRQNDTAFFKKVCAEMGQHPAVLFSIAKLLNEIGSPYVDEGIFWIADMIAKNKNLAKEELRPNTIYYLERVARRYVYLNRTKLKTTRCLRDKLLVLLDFLVYKGSVHGYLLREDAI